MMEFDALLSVSELILDLYSLVVNFWVFFFLCCVEDMDMVNGFRGWFNFMLLEVFAFVFSDYVFSMVPIYPLFTYLEFSNLGFL